MKAMVCEMCGSNDVVKTEGLYVCQHCGTKYDVEEARKLLVEMSGPVTVEGVATTDNLMDRAQEFFDNGNLKKAMEYVTRVLDIDAQNARAREMQQTIEEMWRDVEKYYLGDVEITKKQYREIMDLIPDKKIDAIKLVRRYTNMSLVDAKKYTESVLFPAAGYPNPNEGSSKSGGCYVATSVYGSYDCPEVWTLRRFRDYRLARTRRGRLFIRAYYAVSPSVVKVFGKTVLFRRLLRTPLDAMVSRCKSQGFADTPYDDMDW